jgi:adenylylsulfate kinase
MEKTPNLFWDPSRVLPADRERLLHQRGCVLWFAGLSGSGKSTIARALEKSLISGGHLAYVLDGDNIRHGLNAGLGFSEEDRAENLRRISEVAGLFADCGVLCITAFISPLRAHRARARDIIGQERLLEVYVSTPLEVCEARDVKGLYRKARAGELPEFTGISSPFEAPEAPAIALDTTTRTVSACVDAVEEMLRRRGVLLSPASG